MQMSYKTIQRVLLTAAIVGGLVSFFYSLPTPSLAAASSAESTSNSSSADADQPLAFRDVRIFDGEKAYRGNVVVEDGKLAAVGPQATIPANARIIDGAGKTLLPGLIDAHTHSWGDALERAIVFGVTTHLDMFTEAQFAAATRAEQAAGKAHHRTDLFSASTLVTAAGGHGTQFGMPIPTLDDASEAQAFVDARIAEGADFIKLVYEPAGGRMPTLSPEALHAGIAAAKKRGKLAVVHISTLDDARLALDGGADGLVHIFHYGEPSEEFGLQVKQQGAFVIPTLAITSSVTGQARSAVLDEESPLREFVNAGERRGLKADFGGGRAPAPERYEVARQATALLHRAGVPILAGTDAPNPGTTYGASMHDELLLLIEAGLSAEQALTAATAAPADHFGLNDRGRLEAGRRADLLLVEGDPTTDIRATQAILGVWKAGHKVDRQPAAKPATGPAKVRVLSAFGDSDLSTDFGSDWATSDDSIRGGTSTVELSTATKGQDGDWAMRITGEIRDGFAYPWAGAMAFAASPPMQPADLSAHRSISFEVRGDRPSFNLMIFSGNAPIPVSRSIEISSEWQHIELSFEDLAIDAAQFKAVLFSGGPAKGAFDLWIDNVKLE